MTQNHRDIVETEVNDFAEHLGKLQTMEYALEHSLMEHWIAIEGLNFFEKRGWSAWETLGFITTKPVHRNKKNRSEYGIKFPDLVAVRGGISVWFEFKTMSRRTLHPHSGGGTLARDLLALAAFNQEETLAYLKAGNHDKARKNSDARTIRASGLFDEKAGGPLAKDANVGVAFLIWPSEDKLQVPNHQNQFWAPGDQVECQRGRIKVPDVKATKPQNMLKGRAKWQAWLVTMGQSA